VSKNIVWASNAIINPAMLRPLTHSFGDEKLDFTAQCQRENNSGKPMGAECFPAEIFVRKDATTNYEKLPALFFGFGYWVVSGEVADVMRQFDLGQGHLYPTKVFRKDRKTPIGDSWFCLNFGNVKKAYLRGGEDRTPYISKSQIRHGAPLILKDNMLTASTDALIGPDIWVDPQIRELFFVSDPLAKALKAAGVAGPFGLKKCQVV
jgi:hypothetical protein